MLRYFPTQALNFAFKDGIKAHLSYKKSAGFGKWMAGNIASGAAAGAASSVFVCELSISTRWSAEKLTSCRFQDSLGYARTRLSADNKSAKTGGERQFKGIMDVYKKTLASDGIVG